MSITNLLHKNQSGLNWRPDQYEQAFDIIKDRITHVPILSLPDWNKPFEIMVNASKIATGDGHPVAYETRKLNDCEAWYTAREQGIFLWYML